MSDKAVFEIWKRVSPVSAYIAGVKECSAVLFIPSYNNVKSALKELQEVPSDNPVIKKFISAVIRGLLREEPEDVPNEIMNAFYAHLIKEGVNEKHAILLAEQSL